MLVFLELSVVLFEACYFFFSFLDQWPREVLGAIDPKVETLLQAPYYFRPTKREIPAVSKYLCIAEASPFDT